MNRKVNDRESIDPLHYSTANRPNQPEAAPEEGEGGEGGQFY